MVQKGQFSAFAFMAKTLSPSLPQIVFWVEIKVQPLIHWEKFIGGLHDLVLISKKAANLAHLVQNGKVNRLAKWSKMANFSANFQRNNIVAMASQMKALRYSLRGNGDRRTYCPRVGIKKFTQAAWRSCIYEAIHEG